jgi:hypothetical protein
MTSSNFGQQPQQPQPLRPLNAYSQSSMVSRVLPVVKPQISPISVASDPKDVESLPQLIADQQKIIKESGMSKLKITWGRFLLLLLIKSLKSTKKIPKKISIFFSKNQKNICLNSYACENLGNLK